MKIINRYIDIVSGMFWILIAAAAYLLSLSIVQRASVENTVGPQFMPKLVAVLIMAAGILIVVNGFRQIEKRNCVTGSFPEEKRDMVTVIITIALMTAYVMSLKALGFIASTTFYLFFQLSVFRTDWRSGIMKNAITAVMVACITYFLFRYGFSLTLPTGALF